MLNIRSPLPRWSTPGTARRDGDTGAIVPLTGFGTNPGNLDAATLVPANLAAGAALVVVLHGCTQTAAGYARSSGWTELAAREGFALLLPEQRGENNMNRCFNWFEHGDIARDEGEPASIMQMVDAVIAKHALDRSRVFVTGLSAGGAMANVMLATYPDRFAGGAIIAGLAYGSASSMSAALQRMRGRGGDDVALSVKRVRDASTHQGKWPRVSIWHGTADNTVVEANAEAILAQWRGVHNVEAAPSVSTTADGYPHRSWHDASGRIVIEDYRITGMGHGTPIAAGLGSAAPFVLDVGIASTRHIAAGWGLSEVSVVETAPPPAPIRAPASPIPNLAKLPVPDKVRTVIEDALKTAGLLR